MTLLQALMWLGTVLIGVAIWSRLAADKQVPSLITSIGNAFANIFKGVFHG